MEGAYSTFVGKDDLTRWTVSGATVLAAHILLVVAVLARPDMSDVDAGSPVVTVDLAPVAAAPSTTPSDQPPAPQVQTEAEERTRQDMQQEKQPDQPVEAPEQKSDAELPQRLPDPPKEQQQAKVQQEEQEASHAAAPQSAPVTAALPVAPALPIASLLAGRRFPVALLGLPPGPLPCRCPARRAAIPLAGLAGMKTLLAAFQQTPPLPRRSLSSASRLLFARACRTLGRAHGR